MLIQLTLEGTVYFLHKDKKRGNEQVCSKFLIDFNIDSEGTITAQPSLQKFTTNVSYYDEQDNEEEMEKTFSIKKVDFNGRMLKSVIPDTYSYDESTETLVLIYF